MIEQFYFWLYILKNWKQGLKTHLLTHIHENIIHNSKKVVITQMFIHESVSKQNIAYT